MVRIFALSGELVLELEDVYARMVEDGKNVRDLKEFLAVETGHPRFKQRLLGDGGPLRDDMPLPALASMQLVILNFVDSNETSEKEFDSACTENLVDQVEMLLQKPQDPNGRGPKASRAPIHIAAEGGHLEVVQLLLEARADMNVATGGKTPLDMAVGHSHLEVVQFLVQSGADLRQSLHIAALCGNSEVARLLLDAGAEKDERLHTLDSGMTALHLAAGSGCLKMVQLLVENGANIDVAMTGGKTPWRFMLRRALTCSCLEVERLLGQQRAGTLPLPGFLANGLTALRLAAFGGHLEVVQFLVQRGADLRQTLHIAALRGNSKVARLLLDAGAEKDERLHTLDSGMTALHLAAGSGCLKMVQLLVENGANIDVAMTGGKTPWRFMPPEALTGRSLGVERLLGKQPAGTLPGFLANGLTALRLAAFGGHLEVVQFLVQSGADLRQTLHIAALCGNSKVARLLLDAGAEKDERLHTLDSGMTALHLAAGNGCLKMVQLLVENGANIDVAMTGGKTPWRFMLRRALTCSCLEVERLLGKQRAGTLPLPGFLANGLTALRLAAFGGHLEVVQFLVQSGADLRQTLHIAALCGNSKVARLLLDAGAEKDERLHTLDSGMTALHLAAGSGCLKMVQLLVENGANIDVAMTGGKTPWRSIPCVSVVNGSTAVRLAFLCGHQDVVRFLVGARFEQSAAQQRVCEIYMA